MQRTITFGQKLTVAFATLLVLALLQSCCLLIISGRMGAILDQAVNVSARKLDRAFAMHGDIEDMSSAAKETQTSYVIASLATGAAAASCASCHSLGEQGGEEARFEGIASKVRNTISELDSLGVDSGERQLLQSVKTGLTGCADLYRQYLVEARAKRFSEAHDILKDKLLPAMEALSISSARLAEDRRTELAAFGEAARAKVNSSRWIGLALSACGLFAVLASLWLVRKSFSTLRSIAVRLERESEHVAGAARQIAGASESMAQGASEQASSLDHTVSAGREIQATAQNNLENAQSAAAATDEVVRRVVEANTQVDELTSAMQAMIDSSDQISRIIKTIDGIAFQTNILALNAAVEAARAGESGMGFAVVAGEVRSLALRCAEAARDTSALIDASVGKAHDSKARLDRVAVAVHAINEHAVRVKTLADEVKSVSQEQTSGIGQIAKSLQQIDQLTRQTASGAEEGAAAGRDLSQRSDELRELIEELTTLIGQSKGQT